MPELRDETHSADRNERQPSLFRHVRRSLAPHFVTPKEDA